MAVTANTFVITNKGNLPVVSLIGEESIQTPSGQFQVQTVDCGIVEIWRIGFSNGGHLDCSYDHALRCMSDTGALYFKSIAKLKVGDSVFTTLGTAIVSFIEDQNIQRRVYTLNKPEIGAWITNGYVSKI